MDVNQDLANYRFLLQVNVVLRSPSPTPYYIHMSIRYEHTACRNNLPIICRIIFVRYDLDDKLLRAPTRLCEYRRGAIVIMRRDICQGGTLQRRTASALELTKKRLIARRCTEKVQTRDPPEKVEDLTLPAFRHPGVTLVL
jgi:hypothetical protein